MRTLVIVLALALAGCSDDDSRPSNPDSAVPDAVVVPPDAEVPDAEVPDAMPPCLDCGYVFDSITVPADADQAEALGFDLDGDGTVDNQMGNILSALTQASGGDLNLQEAITQAVDRGEILVLGSLQECLPGLCLFTYHGSDPAPAPCTGPGDLTCRHHLDGTGLFTIDPPTDRFVPGSQTGDTFTGGPGQMVLELVIGEGAPAEIELVQARAALTGVSENGFTGGKVGGAIPDAYVQDELIPATHVSVAATIADDCTGGGPPTCGCESGSTGETMMGIFDENEDCAVPLEEFRENSLIVTLFRPDVDTDSDDTADSLSVGVGVTAVAAEFRP
jgi:hypothetical protein